MLRRRCLLCCRELIRVLGQAATSPPHQMPARPALKCQPLSVVPRASPVLAQEIGGLAHRAHHIKLLHLRARVRRRQLNVLREGERARGAEAGEAAVHRGFASLHCRSLLCCRSADDAACCAPCTPAAPRCLRVACCRASQVPTSQQLAALEKHTTSPQLLAHPVECLPHLVGVVQRGADELRHGTVHHNEVLVAVGLHACKAMERVECSGSG